MRRVNAYPFLGESKERFLLRVGEGKGLETSEYDWVFVVLVSKPFHAVSVMR